MAYISTSQEEAKKLIVSLMEVFKDADIISEFSVYTNGKWSIGVKFKLYTGEFQYTYCINMDWFPFNRTYH